MSDDESYQVIRYIDLVMDPVPGEKSAVDNFAIQLDIKVMAGITMTGTSPTFFKIPVTLELIEAIQRGEYPATPTVVAMHYPAVPRPAHRLSEGMRPLDNRRCIRACFEAFRQFVN